MTRQCHSVTEARRKKLAFGFDRASFDQFVQSVNYSFASFALPNRALSNKLLLDRDEQRQTPISKVKNLHTSILFCVVFTITTALSWKSAFAAQSDLDAVVKVSTFWSHSAVKPNGQITLAVVLDIRPPFHISPNTAKAPFVPTQVGITSSYEGLRSSTPNFPQPETIDFGKEGAKEKVPVFSGRTVVFIPMALNESARPGEDSIQLKITYQACDTNHCLKPLSVEHVARLSVVDPTAEVKLINVELFRALESRRDRLTIAFFGWDFSFGASHRWLLLFIAAIGGLLLNFTPCVLPLIPIKIMGLSRAASNRSRCLILGSAMSAGVMAFWIALAIAITSISGFNAANKLFQYPWFTVTIGIVICLMAVGMCGLFSTNLPSWIYRVNPSQQSAWGSFFFGVMTAVLSTPCTAPFMGAAAAWATAQNAAVSTATFAAIGFGMALPYLVLSAFPAFVQRLPKTGPASELIKQTMGLLLLAAGAYFLGTGLAGWFATPPDPPSESYWWAVAIFLAAAGGWLAWRTMRITSNAARRALFAGLGAALIVIGATVGVRFTRGSPIHWIYFTPARLAAAQAQKRIVVLDFTAAWCLNCRALEEGVLHNPRVVKLLNSTNVAPIKVDITGNNPAGDRKLVEVGRRTIPYLVVYSRFGQEVFSSDAYSVEQVTDAIESVVREAR